MNMSGQYLKTVLIILWKKDHTYLLLVRKDMDVNEYERLSNATPKHILKQAKWYLFLLPIDAIIF